MISDHAGDRAPHWSPVGAGTVSFDRPSLVANCPADDTGYLQPRLTVGETAQVIPGQVANRVRTLPSADSDHIADLGGGVPFSVIGGPVCDPDTMILWWKVRIEDNEVGWTTEGTVGGGYFVERVP